MRIGCVGYYGYGNLGDELFLAAWRHTFVGHDVGALQQWERPGQYHQFLVGGGDLVVPSRFTNAYWRPELFAHGPVAVYGVGVPTEADGSPAVEGHGCVTQYRDYFARCAEVSVRDPQSAEVLTAWGVRGVQVVPDLAWGVPIRRIALKVPGNRPLIGVTVRPGMGLDLMVIVRFIETVLADGADVLLIPLQGAPTRQWRDDAIHELLWRAAGRSPRVRTVPADYDLEHRIAAIGACQFYVGARLHGLIMAARQGVSCALLGASRKFRMVAWALGVDSWLVTDELQLLEVYQQWRARPQRHLGMVRAAEYLEALSVQRQRELAVRLLPVPDEVPV